MGLPQPRPDESFHPTCRAACRDRAPAGDCRRAGARRGARGARRHRPLLGIFNRRGFERELKRSLAYVKRYWTRAALMFVDLDGFKVNNDRYGHAAGDASSRRSRAS